MRAIAHTKACPLTQEDALVELELDTPQPGPRDLLVEVRGVSINPVDVKVRQLMAPQGDHRVLGWDAAGTVIAVGSEVTSFAPGDEVFYAGDITRPGSNAELQLVDERIVGHKPKSLGFAEAAGHPLTAITAWELLFESFGLSEGAGTGEALLIVGAAGGVGSLLIQLAKRLTGLTVIATASRPETAAWVRKLGADHVVNHREPLDQELAGLGIAPRYVAALTHTDEHIGAIVELIQPRGTIALIDDPKDLDIGPLKFKAICLCWEFMFTRSMFQTADMHAQHELLERVSEMLDAGTLLSTVTTRLEALSVTSLRQAHAMQESGSSIGKTVLDGLESRA